MNAIQSCITRRILLSTFLSRRKLCFEVRNPCCTDSPVLATSTRWKHLPGASIPSFLVICIIRQKTSQCSSPPNWAPARSSTEPQSSSPFVISPGAVVVVIPTHTASNRTLAIPEYLTNCYLRLLQCTSQKILNISTTNSQQQPLSTWKQAAMIMPSLNDSLLVKPNITSLPPMMKVNLFSKCTRV